MKKLLFTLFTLVACVSLSFATVYNGNCGASGTDGDNLTWSLDTDTKVLTISGTGAMDDYHAAKNNVTPPVAEHRAPWYETSKRHIIEFVVLPEGMTHLGDQAFLQCDNLKSITIPAGVETIGNQAFQGCTALTSVEILGSTNISGTSAFTGCTNLTSVSMPYVTGIASSAFSGCTALTSIEIPSGVTVLNTDLFNGCTNLKSVTLPNVGDIKNRVFKNCTSLVRIVYNRTTPPTAPYVGAQDVFLNVPAGGMLFLPNETAKTNFGSPWNGFNVYAHAATYNFDEVSNSPADLVDYTATLEGLKDGSVIDITFTGRTFLRNGDYNTICLPFDLSAAQLADPENPLYNFSFYEITDMYKEGSFLKFRVNQASSVVAGKPYIMKYNGEEANLSNPTFKYVTVTASAGDETVVPGLVKMVGILKPTAIAENENTLFLLSGNRLAWANPGQNTMKGFRAYFEVLVTDHSPYYIPGYRSLKPSLVDETVETPTAIEVVENEETATKVIENGTIYIIKNGVKYNVQGQVISK